MRQFSVLSWATPKFTQSHTEQLAAQGVRLLNFWRLAPTEEGHVRAALRMMDLPARARVIDLGCGTGEFARLALAQRPDLQFTLVNNHAWQLAQAPAECSRIRADMAATGLPDGTADAVVMAYVTGYRPVQQVLREAARLLKPGGVLFWHDVFAATQEQRREWNAAIGSDLWVLDEAIASAASQFIVEQAITDQHRIQCPDLDKASAQIDRLIHRAFILRKTVPAPQMPQPTPRVGGPVDASALADVFARHGTVALQLSGGRDSTATLYLLAQEGWLGRTRIYFTDTGDAWPETLSVLGQIERHLGCRIIRVQTNAPAWRAAHGDPSDIVPARATPPGQMVSGCPTRLCTRYDCCAANLMAPLHQRMVQDGITCIMRGVRHQDYATHPIQSGQTEGAIQYHYPIWHWTADDVDAYLLARHAPLAPWYAQGQPHGNDCLHCTAWWDDGRFPYLQRAHPGAWQQVKGKLAQIKMALAEDMGMLNEVLRE